MNGLVEVLVAFAKGQWVPAIVVGALVYWGVTTQMEARFQVMEVQMEQRFKVLEENQRRIIKEMVTFRELMTQQRIDLAVQKERMRLMHPELSQASAQEAQEARAP